MRRHPGAHASAPGEQSPQLHPRSILHLECRRSPGASNRLSFTPAQFFTSNAAGHRVRAIASASPPLNIAGSGLSQPMARPRCNTLHPASIAGSGLSQPMARPRCNTLHPASIAGSGLSQPMAQVQSVQSAGVLPSASCSCSLPPAGAVGAICRCSSVSFMFLFVATGRCSRCNLPVFFLLPGSDRAGGLVVNLGDTVDPARSCCRAVIALVAWWLIWVTPLTQRDPAAGQ